jgi:hypothetical protein
MDKQGKSIAGVQMRGDAPTEVPFRDLFTWTIWQFPRKKSGGLLAAVRPPDSEHGWLPAIVHAKDKRAQVHAHLNETFSSPEAAVEHLGNLP